jgi:hypothetical protein
MSVTDGTYLRAIELLLGRVDARLPDDSMAPKPYEITATEMRDIMRLARRQTPRTRAGLSAWREATE